MYFIQELVFVLVIEDIFLEGVLLVESLRVVVEVVVLQIGFSYDESIGLYFDYSIGFYYDFVSILEFLILYRCIFSCLMLNIKFLVELRKVRSCI